MLQSIVRYILTVLFTWLVAKGVVTQLQVDSDLPTIIQIVALIISSLAIIGWSYLEKLFKGHITATGANVPPLSVDSFQLPIRYAKPPTAPITQKIEPPTK